MKAEMRRVCPGLSALRGVMVEALGLVRRVVAAHRVRCPVRERAVAGEAG